MITLFITLTIITAILLILIASLQSSKKEGTGSPLGNMGAHQIMGVKKTGDLLEQITWGLLTGLFVLSIGTSLLIKRSYTSNVTISPNLERAQQEAELMLPNQQDSSPINPEQKD